MKPSVLTIAGSDSGGGAGIQADLKTFSNLGVHGATVITAITSQNTLGVQEVLVLPVKTVISQLNSVLSDLQVTAAKTGMLARAAIIEALAEQLHRSRLSNLVVDPVMVAASGDPLIDDEAVKVLKEKLLPLSLVVTPNLPEAEVLSGLKITEGMSGWKEAARRIAGLGPRWVLLKGGHFHSDSCTDLLFDGRNFLEFSARRVTIDNPHGTGCTLSAALAANLVLGYAVPEAVEKAKDYLTAALERSFPVGTGYPPVNNLAGPVK